MCYFGLVEYVLILVKMWNCLSCIPRLRRIPKEESVIVSTTVPIPTIHSAEMNEHVDVSPHNDSQSMYSAFQDERNSITSFISIEADPNDALLITGRSNMELFKSLVLSKTGFTTNGTLGRTQLWYLPRSSSGFPMVSLGEVTVPSSIGVDRIASVVGNIEKKSLWDPDFAMGRQIKITEIDANSKLTMSWTASKAKPGIAGRDFLYHAYSERSLSEWAVVCWGVEAELIPPGYDAKQPSPLHVRGKLVMAGYYVRKNPQNPQELIITYVNQIELGLPYWLTDPVLKKSPALLNGLVKHLEENAG